MGLGAPGPIANFATKLSRLPTSKLPDPVRSTGYSLVCLASAILDHHSAVMF